MRLRLIDPKTYFSFYASLQFLCTIICYFDLNGAVSLIGTDEEETGITDAECSENQQTETSAEEAALPAEYVFCQLCQKDLSHLNSHRRVLHINNCIDQVCDNVMQFWGSAMQVRQNVMQVRVVSCRSVVMPCRSGAMSCRSG